MSVLGVRIAIHDFKKDIQISGGLMSNCEGIV